jgi:hypothetical protein
MLTLTALFSLVSCLTTLSVSRLQGISWTVLTHPISTKSILFMSLTLNVQVWIAIQYIAVYQTKKMYTVLLSHSATKKHYEIHYQKVFLCTFHGIPFTVQGTASDSRHSCSILIPLFHICITFSIYKLNIFLLICTIPSFQKLVHKIKKKFWEELIAYFPLIRRGPNTKWRLQQFFHCYLYSLPQKRVYWAVA